MELKNIFSETINSPLYIKQNQLIHNPDPTLINWRGAVLALLVEDSFFFIKRSLDVPTHKGQIAFIGGHRKESEQHPYDVCRREFEEECKISSLHLEFLGLVPLVFTSSQTPIVPVLSKLNMDLKTFKNQIESNGEWDIGFTVSRKNLASLDLWGSGLFVGQKREYLMYYKSLEKSDFSVVKSYTEVPENLLLWGATARMVWNFYKTIEMRTEKSGK
ncbi:MAG: NUDIX domain-containing protein [Bacteriovoracaceae bacterium]